MGADDSAAAAVLGALAGLDLSTPPVDGPFLSVMMRTRGTRLEALRDALVCLGGQSDQDFEVVLAVHNPITPDTPAVVAALVAEEVPQLAERVRVIVSLGGTVAHPLNEIVEAGRGQYYAMLDDDDLVFSNWVATYRAGAAASPGRVLRSVIVDQPCRRERWDDDREGLVAAGVPVAVYPARFSLLEHIVGGATAEQGFAFPRRVFFGLGLRFDESLSVHEDWDLQLRAIQYLGVHSCEELTGVYRRHPDSDSLATHPSAERDVFFDALVRRLVDGQVFLVDGEELLEFRSRAKLVDQMWHEKEIVFTEKQAALAENEVLVARLARLDSVAGAARRLAGALRSRLRAARARPLDPGPPGA